MNPDGDALEPLRSRGHTPELRRAVWRFTTDGGAVYRYVALCPKCRRQVARSKSLDLQPTRAGRKDCKTRSAEAGRHEQRREDVLVVVGLVAALAIAIVTLNGFDYRSASALGLALAGLALPMLVLLWLKGRRKRLLRRVGITVVGSVIESSYSGGGQGGGGFRSVVAFSDGSGTNHTFKTSGELSGEVEVVYDPKRPRVAQVADNMTLTFNERFCLFFFGAVFLLAFLASVGG